MAQGPTLKRKIAFYRRLGYKYEIALKYAKEDLKEKSNATSFNLSKPRR